MSQLKVLIADDEEDILDVMSKKVSSAGYTVISARDGQDAWEKIGHENPDIILLDLTMPRLDGFAVLKMLRESPPSEKWIPVIIISALGELEDMKRGFDLEADHYLNKPCQMEDVIKGIRLMTSLIPQRKSKFEMDSDSSPKDG